MNVVETRKHRGVTFKLTRDADGFWGWIIGNDTMIGMFSQRDSALRTAQRHIEEHA